jgi:hypothetical protein
MVTGANDSYAPIDQEVANQYGIAGAGNMVSYTTIPGLGHAVPPAASYYVDCMNFIDSHPGTATGIFDPASGESLGYMHVYPNPSVDIASVAYQLYTHLSSNAELIVTDMLGREVEHIELYGQTGIVQLKEITNKGIYILKLYSNGKEVTEPVKFIKIGE